MSKITITRGPDGRLEGISEADQRGFARLKAKLSDVGQGQTLVITWAEPRSGPFHRRHFALLASVFECQDQFSDPDQFRKWVEVGAGHCDLVPGPRGKPCAIPRSIAYEKLEQGDFQKLHEAVVGFLQSTHCTRFLWPHLPDEAGAQMVESVMLEFA